MEKAQTKQERIIRENSISRGIRKRINGKAVFMHWCMRYKECLEQVLEKLQDERIREKLQSAGDC